MLARRADALLLPRSPCSPTPQTTTANRRCSCPLLLGQQRTAAFRAAAKDARCGVQQHGRARAAKDDLLVQRGNDEEDAVVAGAGMYEGVGVGTEAAARNGNSTSSTNGLATTSTDEAATAASSLSLQTEQQGWNGNLRKYAWLAFWISAAIAFGAGIWFIEGGTKGKEFFAGYLLEQCLSLDNLFVFQLVFSYFKTPESGQASVLTYGITTAAVLRAVLILAGVQLVQQWKPVLLVFAAILVFSSYKLLTEEKGGEGEDADLSQNAVLQVCKRFIRTTDDYDGDKFFTMLADGSRCATPLLLALAVVELSDVVFALDSIPAIFGVTVDPFIVYTSNMFAILSLRAVYSFASSAMVQARYLDKAVAVVLGFIGVKLMLEFGQVDIPTDVSLLFVGLVLAAGAAAGYLLPETSVVEKEM